MTMERKTHISVLQTFIFALLAFCSTWNASVAQDDADTQDDPKKKPDVEMLECNVKVIDPDGHPVEEATVYCTGLRSKEQPGSHWGWSGQQLGKVPKIKTDAEGIAKMPYPKMLSDEYTTGEMTWSVEHPDFVNYRRDHSVDDDPAEITMERGFRIALTAVDASGEKIKENLYAVASFTGGGEWEVKKNGTLVSSVMKKQDGILRVVCFEENKPTLFSDEIEIKPGDKSRVLLKDIQLSLGCRVEGRLNDEVTRPVKNGYVIANIVKLPNRAANLLGRRPSWHWSDEAKISEDGTFVFESLPADVAVQVIPICDGWVPAKPKAEEVLAAIQSENPDQVKRMIEAFSATPQVFKIGDGEITANLEMVKGFSVRLKVVDQDDEPLKGIDVGTAPNQYWFNSGSQILGDSYSTRSMWQLKQDGVDLMTHFKSRERPYFGKTDEEGMFVFKNMPPGSHDISARTEGWEMPKDPMGSRFGKRIQVRDHDRKITIKLYPKGKLPKVDPNSQTPLSDTVKQWWDQLMESNKTK
jgi:hypothetical protein